MAERKRRRKQFYTEKPEEIDYITSVLSSNLDKSFVKRIVEKDKYPVLKNDDGSVSTHSMASGEADGKYYAYPTVLMGEDKKLKRYKGRAAFKRAMKSGNFIEFGSDKEALWFSKYYKSVWPKDGH